MTLKIKGKSWKCNNQCGSNCCSSVFLPLSPEQRVSLETKGHYKATHDYTDWKWLKYHKSFKVIKIGRKGKRIIKLDKEYRIRYNEIAKTDYLFVKDPCSKLDKKNNKCRVYRARPKICAVAKCPVFTDDRNIAWFGRHGLLKELRKKYDKGELEKL